MENVKAIMEVETNVPMASQIILLNGKPISDGCGPGALPPPESRCPTLRLRRKPFIPKRRCPPSTAQPLLAMRGVAATPPHFHANR